MPPLTLLLSMMTPTQAADLEVPNNYPTAQAAVNDATSGVDRIVFTADVVESWSISNKTLEVASDGGSWVGTLTVTTGANVTVQSMTLQGGIETTDVEAIQAGQNCVAQTPQAVVVSNAILNVSDSTFKCYNTAIAATNSSVTIDLSEFKFNYHNSAVTNTGGSLVVTNSDFEFNTGTSEGGAIRSEGNLTEISTSSFLANGLAGGEGAGLFAKSDTVFLDDNEFNNNFNLVWWIPGFNLNDPAATTEGGVVHGQGVGAGVYVEDPDGGVTDLYIHDNTFCGNLADEGAGLYINDVREARIYNNRFADNWSAHFGGGLYIEAAEEWTLTGDEAKIVNNTFLNNTAGLLPPPYLPLVTVIGGGGHVALDGTVVDFRNNIAAFSNFGGAMLGIDGPDYIIGDFLTMDYNIFFWNCDESGCGLETPEDWQNFTGDMNQISLPATNLDLDPFPTYFGEGEFNCIPDAFYPTWGSPAVRNGDAVNEPNIYSPEFSDIGAYGGPDAHVLDRDGDTFENIYDCNDDPLTNGAQVFPGAPEQCDQIDNNCDGVIDEGFETNWYIDADGDGFGDVSQVMAEVNCVAPTNHVTNRDDCNDTDPLINPAAPEICNGLDDDCDFAPDGGLPFLPLWNDNDNDGYGAGAQLNGCPAEDGNAGYYVVEESGLIELDPSGLVENQLDCNDFNANISPVASEVCDGLDNDCNQIVDDAEDGGQRFYTDGDGDGFGAGDGVFGCEPPDAVSVTSGGDCDDFNAEINPSKAERCDDIDNDCDGTIDRNAVDAPQLYEDLDNDGLGNPATAIRDCNPGPSYTTSVGGDCDDNDPTVLECADCGCQATPTPLSTGGLAALLALVFGVRRRRQ